jgi:hypothetical protein
MEVEDPKAVPPAYGLGLAIQDKPHGRLYSHPGRIQGFTSWTGTYPDAGVTIALITNTDGMVPAASKVGPAIDGLQAVVTEAVFAHG